MKMRRVLVAVVALLAVGTAKAQQMPPIPVDPSVKVGHLDNGLTYYIRHNEYPEHVASFYIAQRVGSVNEEESQRGLAHLLEHLAFNGTDHFQGNQLQEYLQSIGVEYGRNLNAYTSTDQTVYFFTDVPTKRSTAVDSCMMILKDWSNGITLSQEAIDDERDVVHNEYRMRVIGIQRILERALPALYPGSKYGERFPIGLMSVIDGCSPEAIRSYYRKWYRPDNQAIIVVGDIDVDSIESKIKTLFGDIKVPADAAQVIPEAVPDNNEAIYVIDKDKELQAEMMLVSMKQEAFPDSMKTNMLYLIQGYVNSLIGSMMNARFTEKAQESDCPYLNASADYGKYLVARTEDALSLAIIPKPGKTKEAYAAALTELKRAKEYGFTGTEYTRARDEYMSRLEKAYTNRDKMKNQEFTDQYVSNFISNEPIPSVEQEYQMMQQIAPMIPVDVANMAMKQYVSENDTNYVVLLAMQDKEGLVMPTADELKEVTAQARASKVEAYVDNVKQEPLISKAPKAGSVKKVTENAQLGYKELTLSNGAKVILKKTDFKDDEIVFSAAAKGGTSALGFKDATSQFLSIVASASGLGNFSNTELEKALAGKQVSVGLSMGDYTRGMSGHSTPKDIETMMQLIYLNMTSVAKDEKSFGNVQQTYATILQNQSNNASMVFNDSLSSTLYMGNKVYRIPTSEDVMNINYDEMLKLIHNFYSNASEFTFYFVGNFDEATLLPLINTYIASLPAKGKAFKNKNVKMFSGDVKNVFSKKMENPQSQVHEYWLSEAMPYTLRNSVTNDIASRLLDMAYNRSIREKLSAAYHAGASEDMNVNADNTVMYVIDGNAMLNPDKVTVAVPYFFSEMDATVAAPNAEDLQKAKEILLKQADVDAKTNSYWMGVLRTYQRFGIDTHTDYKSTISSTTAETISDYLKTVILKSGNHAEVLMNAEQQ